MNKTKEGSMRVVFVDGGENMCDVKGFVFLWWHCCDANTLSSSIIDESLRSTC